MSLDPDKIRRIARLARIAVNDAEVADSGAQLNNLLGLIDRLQAVDTAGIEPMSHPLDAHLQAGQRLRADKVTEPDRREQYQACAPAIEEGLYLVPRVVE